MVNYRLSSVLTSFGCGVSIGVEALEVVEHGVEEEPVADEGPWKAPEDSSLQREANMTCL